MRPEIRGPISAMHALRAVISEDPALFRFQCHRCTRISRITRIVLWGALVGIFLLMLLAERLGPLK